MENKNIYKIECDNKNEKAKKDKNFDIIVLDKSSFSKQEKILCIKKEREIKKEAFIDWKKSKNLQDKKIFICNRIYPDIKLALEKRGWVENIEQESLFFDLKWCLRKLEIDFNNLDNSQIVNHFNGNTKITRKAELCRNLRNLIWFRNVDMFSFFPRCYDLSELNDLDDFIEDFKLTKAESTLKEFISTPEDNNFSIEQIILSYNFLEKKLKDINDIIDDEEWDGYDKISEFEWNLISQEKTNLDLEKIKRNLHMNFVKNSDLKILNEKKKQKLEKIIQISKFNQMKKNEIVDEINKLLKKLEKSNPQYSLNGKDNIWILKPAGLSRGRGISCISKYSEFLKFIKCHGNHYVAQKYIENPFIIHNRKFDIRVWVLVTSWNPLTIWIFDSPYVRFGAEDYNTQDLNNLYIHLTNNSISKNSENFTKSIIEGNMWETYEFINYLKEQNKKDVWNETLRQKIYNIIIWSLESSQDLIETRKCSHELYGFDIMVDTHLQPWLIEINSSPCMDYSTKVTEKLVKLVLEDLIKVIIDFPNENKELTVGMTCGLFYLAYLGDFVEESKSLGKNFILKGVNITPNPDL